MIVGLTGGIGSGKTVIAKVLAVFGAAVFFSDDEAKAAYLQPEIAIRVKKLLGENAYLSDTMIDRQFIAGKIFGDASIRAAINDIIHPYVAERFLAFAYEHREQVVVKESALLYEAGIHTGCEKVIVVVADDETRIRRVCERDGIGRDAVLAKMSSQLPQEEKAARADYVIRNDESALITPALLKIYKELNRK